MRVSLRTIIFVFLSLIFISKPIVADASITTETIRNIGSFYANSTSSLIDETNEKIYEVRDFYAPLFADTATSLKGIFNGAFIVSDTALNSVVSLGRGVLNVGEYQIQNTGMSIESAVASASVALGNVREVISKKTNGAIETTNVAVSKMVKQVASTAVIPKASNSVANIQAKPVQNIASARSVIDFAIPSVRDLGEKVLTVYENIGNEFLDSVAHTFTRTGESWSEIASVTGNVIANVNKNIDEATVALGNAGLGGVKNVLDSGTIVGNGVLHSSEKIIIKTGNTVAGVLVKTEGILSRLTEDMRGSLAETNKTSIAGIGSIWDSVIDKISGLLAPLFTTDDTLTPTEPINIIGDNTETKGTNTIITNNNTVVEKIIERPEYFTINNLDGLSDLRFEMISLNNNSVEYLKSLIARQGYINSESIHKSIERSSSGSSSNASGDITADTLSIGSLNGILEATNGVVSATSAVGVTSGGTGISTAPTYGQLLMGNGSGLYDLVATSSLGISQDLSGYFSLANWYATTTDALDEGSINQYWTNTRFDNRLSATTTLPNILTVSGLSSFGTLGATTTSAGNLSIAGSLNFDGSFYQNGSAFVGSQWTTTGSDVYYSTGKVGIGTTNFNSLDGTFGLEVYHATLPGIALGTASKGFLLYMNNDDKFHIWDSTANAERFVIDSAGNVGIGSTTPFATFAVNPTAGGASNQFVVGSSTATNFIINNLGYVGIGTASPSYQLEITGDFNTSSGVIKTAGTTRITNSGGFSGSVGNVTTPGFSFSIDSNTGMYRPSADNLGLVTAGVERFLIGSSGNIGVASSTPWGLLSVNPNEISGPSFTIGSSTATHFVVTNGGNVGIGTTTPGSLFSISGIANFTTATTTLYGLGGINLNSGCFSISSTCITSYSDTLVNSYINASSTIPKTYSANTFTGLQTFNNTSGTIFTNTNGTGTINNGAYATSYSNSGGSGDRLSLITVSTTITISNSTVNKLVNGNTADNTFYWDVQTASGKYLRFDFGMKQIIDEAKWYQSDSSSQGVWRWQGSNDASSWTNIGSTFTLGGATTQTQTELSANTTAYRYYQLLGESGSLSGNPYEQEMEFKISSAVTATTIDNTAGGLYLQPSDGVTRIGGELIIDGNTVYNGAPLVTSQWVNSTSPSGIYYPATGETKYVGIGKLPVTGYFLDVYKTMRVVSDVSNIPATSYMTNSTGNAIIFAMDSPSSPTYSVASAFNLSLNNSNDGFRILDGSTERFRFQKDGKMGVGSSTPSARFSITQSANTNVGGLWIAETGNTDFRSIFMDTSGVMSFYGGDIGGTLNTATLNAAGEWTNASDRNYKDNIIDLAYGLEDLMRIQPRSYTIKNTDLQKIGFIAQEMELVIPEVVAGEDGSKGISYGNLVAVVVKAVQELKTQLDTVLSWFGDGKFRVQNDICVDDVCVTKDQFKQMLLNGGNVTHYGPSNSENSNSNSSNTGSTTETTSTTASSTSTTTESTEEDSEENVTPPLDVADTPEPTEESEPAPEEVSEPESAPEPAPETTTP